MSQLTPRPGFLFVRRQRATLGGDPTQWAYFAKVERLPYGQDEYDHLSLGQSVVVYLRKTPSVLEESTEEREALTIVSFDDIAAAGEPVKK